MATRKQALPPELQRPAAVLQIAHQHFLLPFANAQKVMALMQGARVVEPDFSLRTWPQRWSIESDIVPLEMSTVQPNQVSGPRKVKTGEGES